MKKSGRFEELSLPDGEKLIWQGRPDAWSLALRVFHIRLVALYFMALFALRLAIAWSGGAAWRDAVAGAAQLLIPLSIIMMLLGGLAILYSRTTRYSLTSRRVLLQFGAVLPMSLNIPLAQVAHAGMRAYADGSGDLPLGVTSEQRLSYLLLWPHARPWRLNHVEPMLRCVPDAPRVAKLLADALQASSAQMSGPVIPTAVTPPRARAIATAA